MINYLLSLKTYNVNMWICSHPKDAWRITFPCFELLNLRLRFNLQLRGLKLLIEKKTKSFQQKLPSALQFLKETRLISFQSLLLK